MAANYDEDEQDVERLFDDALELDPAFRAMVEAMDHCDDTDLDGFEFALVASCALAAGEGLSEAEWWDTLAADRPVQIAMRQAGIQPHQLRGRFEQALPHIHFYGLWPWA